MTSADGFRCVLCGGTSARPWRRVGAWSVVRCRQCGLLRTWPPPDATTLKTSYEATDYHAERSTGWESPAAWRERAASVLDAFPTRPSSVLDFGAGPGHLVRALREMDIEADGIEPASTPRAAAATRHGIQLHEGLAELAGCRYDAVVMLHTLEHVDDPAAVLRGLLSILSPGGSIFIEVPHAGGTGIWRVESRKRMLDLPLHLYHFTPKTLKRLVGNVGGEVTDVRLSNCSLVERILAARADHHDDTPDPPSSPTATEMRRPSGTQRAWRSGVLPALRVILPGDSFQLIAQRTAPPPAERAASCETPQEI